MMAARRARMASSNCSMCASVCVAIRLMRRRAPLGGTVDVLAPGARRVVEVPMPVDVVSLVTIDCAKPGSVNCSLPVLWVRLMP